MHNATSIVFDLKHNHIFFLLYAWIKGHKGCCIRKSKLCINHCALCIELSIMNYKLCIVNYALKIMH